MIYKKLLSLEEILDHARVVMPIAQVGALRKQLSRLFGCALCGSCEDVKRKLDDAPICHRCYMRHYMAQARAKGATY